MDWTSALVNFLGLLILAVSIYMISVNLILPRLHIPWLGERRVQQWIERGEELRDRDDLNDEDRQSVEIALATLKRHSQQSGESWSWSDPRNEAINDLKRIQERYQPGA